MKSTVDRHGIIRGDEVSAGLKTAEPMLERDEFNL